MESSWSDLLRKTSPAKPPRRARGEGLIRGTQPSPTRTRTGPPGGKVGSKKTSAGYTSGSRVRVQVEALRSQVARLLREKRELEERGKKVRGGDELN